MKRTIMKWMLLLAGWLGAMPTSSSAQSPQLVAPILTNRTIFGKDFAAALRSLPAWNALGEREVTVFAHQVVGATSFDSKPDAEKRASQLNEALSKEQAKLKSEFSTLSEAAPGVLRVEGIALPEDDSFHAAVTDSSLQLLNPDLTPARLTEALGKPTRVRYVTVQNKTERLPIQLTLYEYADGQIAFAVPNPTLKPGLIDRAILNVRSIYSAVFQEAK